MNSTSPGSGAETPRMLTKTHPCMRKQQPIIYTLVQNYSFIRMPTDHWSSNSNHRLHFGSTTGLQTTDIHERPDSGVTALRNERKDGKFVASKKVDQSLRENRHLGMLFLRAPPSTIPDRDIDTVAFAVVETAVYESAQSVSLQIHRRGPCRNAIYVEWKTENLPLANGGVMSASYRDQGGSFEFQPEQEIATIQIAVEENDDWNL